MNALLAEYYKYHIKNNEVFIMSTIPLPRISPSLTLREVKLLAEPVVKVENEGVFEGYASLFGVPDLGKDIVLPGAFKETLNIRGAQGVKLLWQHNPSEPIGRWLSLTEDRRGLHVRGKLNLSVARARDIYALMKDGAVDGLSIGYRSQKTRLEPRSGYRRLEQVDLWEISLVTFPMLPQARVLNVKRDPPRVGSPPQKSPLNTRVSQIFRALTSLLHPTSFQHPYKGN
jgi:uncharacterized protein